MKSPVTKIIINPCLGGRIGSGTAAGRGPNGSVRRGLAAGRDSVRAHERRAREKYIIEAKGGGGIAWVDYDDDGFPDLFFVNGSTFEDWRRGTSPRSRLYHNNGNGTFTDVSAGSGLDRTGWGMGVCAADYDNDGNPDLYVTYYGGNVLYRNLGGGRFLDETKRAGVPGAAGVWVVLSGTTTTTGSWISMSQTTSMWT